MKIFQKVNLSFLKNIPLILLVIFALIFVYATPTYEKGYLERLYSVENNTNANIDNSTLYNTIKETILSIIDTSGSEDYEYINDYDVKNKTVNEMIDDYESMSESQNKNSTSDDSVTYKNVIKQVTTEKEISEKELDMLWLKKMEDRFERRRVTLKNGCKKLKSNNKYLVERTLIGHLFMPKNYDLIVCAVAKAGSTTWKAHLLTLDGYKVNGDKLDNKSVHYPTNSWKIRAGHRLSMSEVQTRMNSSVYTRIMTVRHPLDRLVSAYRDKFNNGESDVDGLFKKEAISHLKISDKDLKRISFEEFLKIVIGDQGSRIANIHWRTYCHTCSPCQLTYDYIMMVETYSEDLSYIFRKLGVTEINPELRQNGLASASDKSKYENYYKDIPANILIKIHQLYKEDYELFGYDVPNLVKRIL